MSQVYTTIKFEKRGWIGLWCRGIHNNQVEEERTDIQGQRRGWSKYTTIKLDKEKYMQWTRRREERNILTKVKRIWHCRQQHGRIGPIYGVLCVNLLVIAMQLSEHTTKKSHEKIGYCQRQFDPAAVVVCHWPSTRRVCWGQRCAVKTWSPLKSRRIVRRNSYLF
jgi:hypothetical protein